MCSIHILDKLLNMSAYWAKLGLSNSSFLGIKRINSYISKYGFSVWLAAYQLMVTAFHRMPDNGFDLAQSVSQASPLKQKLIPLTSGSTSVSYVSSDLLWPCLSTLTHMVSSHPPRPKESTAHQQQPHHSFALLPLLNGAVSFCCYFDLPVAALARLNTCSAAHHSSLPPFIALHHILRHLLLTVWANWANRYLFCLPMWFSSSSCPTLPMCSCQSHPQQLSP